MHRELGRAVLASALLSALMLATQAFGAGPAAKRKPDPWIERGRYVVAIGG